MSHTYQQTLSGRLLGIAAASLSTLFVAQAHAAAPGITGSSFDLTAEPAYISQPDGASVYSWGYGCNTAPAGFAPSAIGGASCPSMQIPGPTMIVHQGEVVTVTLHNNLPAAAGNTSILFPGFTMQPFTDGSPGILTQEALHGGAVTYKFTATTAGTHAYYSGTQGDLQVEMGLYGAVIVLPTTVNTGNCASTGNDQARNGNGESDYRLAKAAFDHPKACYDREYLFQLSELDPAIHYQAEQQAGLSCTKPTGCMAVETEPYHPAYFMMNGRSFPDNLDPNFAGQYPHQPYNGNPHMHPGELTLVREIGTGRLQHPFHEHANHLRVLARDGNMLLTGASPSSNLAGPLLFTTTSTPGLAMDSLIYWTGKGLNWDVYGHVLYNASGTPVPAGTHIGPTPASAAPVQAPWNSAIHAWKRGSVANPLYELAPCFPDASGHYTANPAAPNYYEWCQDHNKPLEDRPFGQVGSGGPVTLPDPNILANGAWYGGSPYLGPDATIRAIGSTPIPPSGTVANSPTEEAGFAFMWHSHNERELTTNNIFPGGMMTLMLVDPRAYKIDETK